jgi:cysteine desulfurase
VLGVDREGLVDLAEVSSAIRDDTTLCSVMYANNEVGAVQPIAEIGAIARERRVPLHTDAVQAAGSLDLNVARLGVDALSVSGHKLGAPKGIGALFVRGRIPLEPVLHGGGQERGHRSGTENVAGAVGLAAAISATAGSREDDAARMEAIRDGFIDEVLETVPDARLTGPREARLPNNASFCFPGTSGESLLLELGRHAIICSSGSACAAGSDEPSHVLVAMGIPPAIAQTAVRFTLDANTTAEQLREVAVELRAAVLAVRSLRA